MLYVNISQTSTYVNMSDHELEDGLHNTCWYHMASASHPFQSTLARVGKTAIKRTSILSALKPERGDTYETGGNARYVDILHQGIVYLQECMHHIVSTYTCPPQAVPTPLAAQLRCPSGFYDYNLIFYRLYNIDEYFLAAACILAERSPRI